MNSKKVNWFFLTTILLHIFIVVLMVVFHSVFTLGIVANFIVSSGIILVPAIVILLLSGDSWRDAIGFYRIKWSTVGMIVLFTYLTMPVVTLINAFSMLFVDNAVVEMSGQVLDLPFIAAYFFIGISGPVSEELVFRGFAYRGYRRSGTLLQAALLSALLFAVGHMNFNQAAYAFVIGIMLVLLVEATGSIWASIIYHVVFNGHSVCMMYLLNSMEKLFPESFSAESLDGQTYIDSMLYSMSVSVVLAAVTSAVAVCVLVWIAKNENRTQRLKQLWTTRRDRKGKMITVPFLIAMALALAFMVTDVVLSKLYT